MAKKKKSKKKKEVDIVEEVGFESKEPTIEHIDELNVEIDEEVYAKIMHWVDKADGEVSGLGKVQFVNGTLRVTSAILLKQENTGVTTDLDAQDVAKAMFELKDEQGHLNFWWHSHVDMDVFWSGTDLDTIHQIGNNGWCLATVFNKKREMKTAYYQKGTGFIPPMFVDDINTTTVFMTTEDNMKLWDKEFEDKVKEKSYSYTPSKFPGMGYQPSWMGAETYQGDADSEADRFMGKYSPASKRHKRDEEDDEVRELDFDDPSAMFTEQEINQMVLREIARQRKGNKRRGGGVV